MERRTKKVTSPLEKASGEGSRGGHIIGHTRTGKPVYEDSSSSGFNASEHREAQKMHKLKADSGASTDAITHHTRQSLEHKEHAAVQSRKEMYKSMYTSDINDEVEALFEKAHGEGSRGGHIIGHDKSGKPIYESSGRKPYPGEEAHLQEPNEVQKRKTFLPPEGTSPHYADSNNMRAYKNLIRAFKQKGMVFQGHINYNPKTDKVETMSPQGDAMVKQIVEEFKAKAKPEGK